MAARTHWTPQMDALLGTATDRAVAARLGLPPAAVTGRRTRLRIAAYGVVVWPARVLALLGTVPDARVAERMGVSQPLVTRKRNQLGIAACGRKAGNRQRKAGEARGK